MPNWRQILDEIKGSPRRDALDYVRRSYLREMSNARNRNLIAYYSGWLQHPGEIKSSINDDDKNGFMSAIHGLDRSKGLDLILHSPGGEMAATESIIDYLHKMFDGDITCFIPQIAMSGGTMIACSCKEIYMGKQSNIGPIDPQIRGIPAHGVLEEFEAAHKDIIKYPGKIPLWQAIIGQYHPTFIGECRNAMNLAGEIVEKRLISCMFKEDPNGGKKAAKIVAYLNNHKDTKMHARHIHTDEAKQIGLKIVDLETDQKLQDTVLTVHHCFMHTFAQSSAVKIIENHNGNAMISHVRLPQPIQVR